MTVKPMLDPLKVIIVGCGGSGSWLASGLAPMLEYRAPGSMLMLVDGDSYEPKNLERQNFTELGNKAQVKEAELSVKFPHTFIVPIPKFVVDALPEGETESETMVGIHDLLDENCIVFTMVDNMAARKTIFDAAREYNNIHVFHGGNDDALAGDVYHYHRQEGRELTDHPADWHPELVHPKDRNPAFLSCQEKAALGGTQYVATNMAVAACLLGRVQHVILDGNEDKAGEINFDLSLGAASALDIRVEETQQETVNNSANTAVFANK